MFLRNQWYAAGWDHEVGGKPMARTICGEPVMHDEARALPFGNGGLHHHIVGEPRRDQEAGLQVDHGKAGHLELLEHRLFRQAGGLEQMHRAGVEVLNVPREVDNPGRVAVAPLNADCATIGKH